jgi:hypothetical protein
MKGCGIMTKSDIIKDLDSMNDNLKYIQRCIDLFYDIQLNHGPLIEVITIIKYEKPRIYSFLKTRFENIPRFKMLFEVNIKHEFARKSLEIEAIYVSSTNIQGPVS